MWQIKTERDVSAVEIPSDEWGVPHTRPSSPGPQCQDEKCPQLLAAKTSQDVAEWDTGLLESQEVPLKGLHTDLLSLTCSKLQHWGSSLKGTRDTWGGIGQSGIRARAAGAAFSKTEVLAEAIVPFLSLPPRASRWTQYLSLHQPSYHCLPDLVIPWDPRTPNLLAPSCFQWLFHTNGLSWLMLQTLL